MSSQTRPRRLSVTQIQARKGGEKIVCLTAYTASVARHLDAQVDLLLVGDSLAMTVYGFDSTLPVTLDMMVAHGAAVVRATAARADHGRSAVRLAIRNRRSRPSAPPRACWPRPAAPRSSSKAARKWPRRSRFSCVAASR